MSNIFKIESLNFKNWSDIRLNHVQIAVSPSWRNGWTKTFFYIKDNKFCYQNVSWIWLYFDCFGWYKHLNKSTLWEQLKVKKIILMDEECPAKAQFRKVLSERLLAYRQTTPPSNTAFQKSVSPKQFPSPSIQIPPLKFSYLPFKKLNFKPLTLNFEHDSSLESDRDKPEESTRSDESDSSSYSSPESDSDIDISDLTQAPLFLELCKEFAKTDFSLYDEKTQKVMRWMLENQNKHAVKLSNLKNLPKYKIRKDDRGNAQKLAQAGVESSSMIDFYKKIDSLDLSFIDKNQQTLKSIPVELLFRIFSYLGGHQLKCLKLVCKEFNDLLGDLSGFSHTYQARNFSSSKIGSYKHLRVLGSFLNYEIAESKIQIGSKNPIFFAKFKKDSLLKVDKEGMWRGDLKIKELVCYQPFGTNEFNLEFRRGEKLFTWSANFNNREVVPQTKVFRPHHLYENGSCSPMVWDWAESENVFAKPGQQWLLMTYVKNGIPTLETISLNAPVSTVYMEKGRLFIGFEAGICGAYNYAIINDELSCSFDFSLLCAENQSDLDEVVYLQRFQKESRFLTVTRSGICKIWRIDTPKQQLLEKIYRHSEEKMNTVQFAKILGDIYLLTSDLNGVCKLTNIQTSQFVLLKHTASVQACTRFCDTLFIAYNDNKMILWNMSNGEKLKEYEFSFSILDMVFNEKCLTVIGSNSEGVIVNYHFDAPVSQFEFFVDRNLNPNPILKPIISAPYVKKSLLISPVPDDKV